MKIIPPDTYSSTLSFPVNGFLVESYRYKQLGVKDEEALTPNGKEFEDVFVTAPGLFKAMVEKAVPPTTGGGVAAFHRDSGTPLVNFTISDGGALNHIEYVKVDASGRAVMTVVDYDADGQADIRLNAARGYNEIWHIDRWYRWEKQDGKTGIVVDGKFTELKRENNRYVVP